MKIYTNDYDMNKPAERTIYVAPQSDFKIGIKVLKDGTPVQGNKIVLKNRDTTLRRDYAINGYEIWEVKSGEQGQVTYDIYVDNTKCFTLRQVTTDSTVYDQKFSVVIPSASKDQFGIVKIGDGIESSGGVISVTQGNGYGIYDTNDPTSVIELRNGKCIAFPADYMTWEWNENLEDDVFTFRCKAYGIEGYAVIGSEHMPPDGNMGVTGFIFISSVTPTDFDGFGIYGVGSVNYGIFPLHGTIVDNI